MKVHQPFQAKIKRKGQYFLEKSRQIAKERTPWNVVRSSSLRYFAFQDIIDCIFYTVSLKSQPFFIQIGSNDGVSGDPLYEFIVNWNWSGVKIEPVKYIFEKLERNFKNFPNIILENSAIANQETSQTFYYLQQDNNAPDWYSQLGSFSLATVLKHSQWIPDLQERLQSTDVPCLTFDALCEKYDIQAIDVIHIDTEGYDFEVIKLVNFQRFKPKIILYEHKHLTEVDRASCEQLLQNESYQFVSTPRDTLAVLETEIKCDRCLEQAWKMIKGEL